MARPTVCDLCFPILFLLFAPPPLCLWLVLSPLFQYRSFLSHVTRDIWCNSLDERSGNRKHSIRGICSFFIQHTKSNFEIICYLEALVNISGFPSPFSKYICVLRLVGFLKRYKSGYNYVWTFLRSVEGPNKKFQSPWDRQTHRTIKPVLSRRGLELFGFEMCLIRISCRISALI